MPVRKIGYVTCNLLWKNEAGESCFYSEGLIFIPYSG
nr:MAG TPA_asm: hypothetical protein [Caudoviricetes sp.]